MEQIKETVYLINDERYLHLRENGAGVGFATYNKVTGEPLESGQISEKNLPPDGQNIIPAARNWYLFELSDERNSLPSAWVCRIYSRTFSSFSAGISPWPCQPIYLE